ncbi:hypothetical protein ACTXMG_11195 [Corynebacterium flavescens]
MLPTTWLSEVCGKKSSADQSTQEVMRDLQVRPKRRKGSINALQGSAGGT